MSRDLESFVAAARAFTDWCLASPRDEVDEALSVHKLLVDLYARVLELRSPDEMDHEREGQRVDDEQWRRIHARAGALPFNYYAASSRPQVVPPESSEIADLADDIADIYRDLAEGLSLYDRGHTPEAEWVFLHSFRSHWGQHASSALYALHCWLTNTDNWA